MACKYFSPKRPSETVTLTFDFSKVLGTTETISYSTWTVEVREGTDNEPSITMVVGSPAISGHLVSHLIGSGIDETTYGIVCEINTDTSQVVQGVGLLKVDANCGDQNFIQQYYDSNSYTYEVYGTNGNTVLWSDKATISAGGEVQAIVPT